MYCISPILRVPRLDNPELILIMFMIMCHGLVPVRVCLGYVNAIFLAPLRNGYGPLWVPSCHLGGPCQPLKPPYIALAGHETVLYRRAGLQTVCGYVLVTGYWFLI